MNDQSTYLAGHSGIVQGITGRAGQLHSRLMMQYGTRIVGGVSPGAQDA